MNRHFDQALFLQQKGDLRAAAACYEQGLSLEPDNADACHTAGVIALELNDLPTAVELLSRATALQPQNDVMWTNLGSALRKSRQWEPALAAFARATALNPDRAEAHLLAGHVYLSTERFVEADASFSKALQARRGWADALEGKGYALRQLDRHDEGLECALAAIAADATRGAAHRLAGDFLQRRLRFEEAEDHYRQALALDATDFPAHLNLGLLLGKRDRLSEGLVHLQQAYQLRSGDVNIAHSYAMALLKAGHLAEGWTLFHWRHRLASGALACRPYQAPSLDTFRIQGKRLLVWTDQGVGDEILFSGLIPDLLAQGAAVTLECGPRLVALFQRSFPGIEIIPRTDPAHPRLFDPFDAHISLADTARWLRPTFASFPKHEGYLVPDRHLAAVLRNSYRETNKNLLVGISWNTASGVKWSTQKSLPLAAWAPLLQTAGITFIDLQYGDHVEEVAAVENAFGVRIVRDPRIDSLENLDGFAAQVAALDAVVTTSNTTAHMAGALNIPVWTLVPGGDGAIWHWFVKRQDSPWYPSMKLIRQRSVGDWSGMLETARAALVARFMPRDSASDASAP